MTGAAEPTTTAVSMLRSLAATIIPSIAVPLSLIGTFGVMYLAGFTINVLTLLAIVLATGLVVDDGIGRGRCVVAVIGGDDAFRPEGAQVQPHRRGAGAAVVDEGDRPVGGGDALVRLAPLFASRLMPRRARVRTCLESAASPSLSRNRSIRAAV